ncbi:protein tyrosine phosphatase [Streptomyces phaeoluteigriseus]|uniref:Protein tyrosine phosphatase n=1 Tax=Streptomyces phaeoluteigriseus TaxID=114686 RepID=A0A1V6MKD6_9ACTN|nr:tyrosine-protein phosphatase [Streptomyces phaeoluteigriseus]OQD52855.1 protein tyrosine phosphatase [Streptomyces phaeoluteigriseus]
MDRHLPFETLHNFRDLGGYRTPDGHHRIRPGRLYRSDSLGKLTPDTPDWDLFLSLGIRTVLDLRHSWEADRAGRVPAHPSFTYRNLSIEHRFYDQAAQTPDVEPGPYLAERYMEVAEDGTEEIREALRLIAGTDAPLVFHCASGKDRTGQLAALVLGLLGIDEDLIVEDYTLTELATPALLADWRTRHDGDSPTWPYYLYAPESVMRLYLTALTSRYGSPQAYVEKALGLDPESLSTTLRNNLLEPATPGSGPPRG